LMQRGVPNAKDAPIPPFRLNLEWFG
jgi:hypothetical protein